MRKTKQQRLPINKLPFFCCLCFADSFSH